MEFAWGFLAGMVACGVLVALTAWARAGRETERPPLPQHRDLVLMPQEVSRLVRGFEVVVQQAAGTIGVRFHLSVGGLRGVEAIVMMARRSDARGTGEPDGTVTPPSGGYTRAARDGRSASAWNIDIVPPQSAGPESDASDATVGWLATARRAEAHAAGRAEPVRVFIDPTMKWTSLEPITEAMAQCPDCRTLAYPCEVHRPAMGARP